MYHKPENTTVYYTKPESTLRYEFKPEGSGKEHSQQSKQQKPSPESDLEKQGE